MNISVTVVNDEYLWNFLLLQSNFYFDAKFFSENTEIKNNIKIILIF